MKRNTVIRTESFVRVDGTPVRFSELTEDQKCQAATAIKITYLNELFRGKAVFTQKEETK